MKVLVTGAKGQLGTELISELVKRGHEAIATDISDMDITDIGEVTEVVSSADPDVIIHCAAWTDVDGAEDNIDTVHNINVNGTKNIIDIATVLECKIVFISSDYVFEGLGDEPHVENSMCCPLSVYGQTKLDGEMMILTNQIEKFFILRVSWLFGKHGKNFVKTMLRLPSMVDHVNVVSDQIGRPTYAPDLSRLIVDMIATEKYGIYHVTNEGQYVSWADFAREIFRISGKPMKVISITSDQYKTVAHRPKNSRLSTSKLEENGFTPLPDWRDALRRYLKEE
jgi:dTDP-4-dehydrorhamnose reductase